VHFNHLGLPVRDYRRSLRFYTAYFGFDPATAQQYPDGTVIVRNADGFDLALYPVGDVGALPAFLHAGFRAADAAEVRALLARLDADGSRSWSGMTRTRTPRLSASIRTGTGSRCTGSRLSWEAPEPWLSSTTPR
jgi:catechol 2,3-dioxygenase-like lactoylglutathione lyase family enzyme